MEQIQNQTTTEAVEKRYSMAELRALSGGSITRFHLSTH
ncbi:hypothetical protein HAPS_1585 [Glaesserella parasuis SH0165]|uniref:Uncharacterized protein n=1 Tax=Glaesserella parasuis serovar 5 (strain SH0165) TaxID=557723 RepID=B8F735_GLAP5|nr:hypothetical protein HAPS_1585 [Glaesserella parasuis SH0165]